MGNFADRLAAAVGRCGNPVMVGLDPRVNLLPEPLLKNVDTNQPSTIAELFGAFCRGVIDVVSPWWDASNRRRRSSSSLGRRE